MSNQIDSERLIEIFKEMNRYEATNIHVEATHEWLEFSFQVDQSYYSLNINPHKGVITLWSDDKGEEIFRAD